MLARLRLLARAPKITWQATRGPGMRTSGRRTPTRRRLIRTQSAATTTPQRPSF
jgi:hypothetical protein